jgi:signal transduction histidine kinase
MRAVSPALISSTTRQDGGSFGVWRYPVVRRIAHPGRPIILIDEGPALALRHRYDEMRKTLDVALQERHPRMAVRLEQPAR